MVHYLTTWPAHFRAVLEGRKPYELRVEDVRRFAKGDVLVLQEYVPTDMDLFDLEPSWIPDDHGYFTGETCCVLVIDEPLRDTRWLQPGVAALPLLVPQQALSTEATIAGLRAAGLIH